MNLFTRWWSLARAMFLRSRWERDMNEELQFHIEQRVEHLVKSGRPRQEAMRRARLEFGAVEGYKETCREARGLRMVDELRCDLRYALRSFRKSPGFTTVAVVSLALGIGLNTAIFSAINAVILRPLPYKDPQRLVLVGQVWHRFGPEPGNSSPANYVEWEKQNHVFESIAATALTGLRVTIRDEIQLVSGQRVSADFFPLLGVQAALGRTFLPEEDKPGVNVVVLSYDLWQGQFGGDPKTVGSAVRLNDSTFRVIGVMPKGFRFFNKRSGGSVIDAWLPYPFADNPPTSRELHSLHAFARLKPGVSFETAQAEMKTIGQRLEMEHPKENRGIGAGVLPLHDYVEGRASSPLLLLFGAVGLVLLIACANVANLLLARARTRRREIAIRVAIGAGRLRVIQQLLTESLLLAFAGGAAGLLSAQSGAKVLNRFIYGIDFGWGSAGKMLRLDEASPDLRVLGFTLALSLLTGLLFGLAPALQGSNVGLHEALKDAGRGASTGRGGARFRNALVVAQIALSLVLLAGAGLMINSLWRLQHVRLGFQPDRLLSLHCSLRTVEPYVRELSPKGTPTGLRVWTVNQTPRLVDQAIERLEKLPGVESAAAIVYGLPLDLKGREMYDAFHEEGQPRPTPQQYEDMEAVVWPVTAGFLHTMGIRLIEGRAFNEHDGENSANVVIINRTMARKFWPHEARVIGKRIITGNFGQAGDDRPRPYEIVGIAEDVLSGNPSSPVNNQMYLPQSQAWSHAYCDGCMALRLEHWFVIRTRTDSATLGPAVRNAIRELFPDQAVDKIDTMHDIIAASLGRWRSVMLLLALCAGLAVLLSAIGVYGVISYAVTQRHQEIGVRIALGAKRSDVLYLVMKSGFVLTLAGLVIGSAAAYWLTRLIANRLYGVTPTDPLTFLAAALVLLIVALCASYLPARRAMGVDPVNALRCE